MIHLHEDPIKNNRRLIIIAPPKPQEGTISFLTEKKIKHSVAGNRTRVAWVKARYPNRWTTTDLLQT